ncbi:cyclin-J [Aedes aegypti]|uniref:Uncharacterized protein n=1 Tax=Aedes aegypti TaxID=7159 RepID=A0A1S4FIY3_AEDAE|nr:cyclin-J [Aedes aegypti]XP_021704679.1 cyclin-J [Aedes aegypti]XP_021704680.1 cyclin-J [Aedes aegypti]
MEIFRNNPSLSRLFEENCTEYSDEIIWVLQEAELNRLTLRYISPQIAFRSSLVNLIRDVGQQQQLRRTTVHLAIYLMDAFMDNHNIANNRLKLTALSCVLLAAKIEENEPKVPSLKDMNKLLRDKCPLSDFVILEVVLLKFFNWQLLIPTTAVFAEYWLLHVVSKQDFAPTVNENQYFERRARASELVLEFLDVTILDITMTNVRPSLLAAACMAAARAMLSVNSTWNNSMIQLTGYTYDEICYLTRALMNGRACLISDTLSRKRPILDSGYITDPGDDEEDDEVVEVSEKETNASSDDDVVFVSRSKRAKLE